MCVCILEYDSVLKKNEPLLLAAKWTELESTVGEISQAQEKFLAFSFTVGAMNFVTITLYMVNREVFPMKMKRTKLCSDTGHQLLSRENG